VTSGSGVQRLAQVANFVTPHSGGLRVVVQELGQAHLRDGGERLVILPASTTSRTTDDDDHLVTVSSPRLPLSAGRYRVLTRRRAVRAALERFGPDVVEVHDQTTLTWVADWARAAGVPCILFSHERLDLVAAQICHVPPGRLETLRRRWAANLAEAFDAIVCASTFAAEPFDRIGADNIARIPFGVDLKSFAPRPDLNSQHTPHLRRDTALPWRDGMHRLVMAGRLYPEKQPELALDILTTLRALGEPAQLVIVGSGPLEAALRQRVVRQHLPVHFIGHLTDRPSLAELLASADVALALGHRETFGFAVLEAMACATPVIVSAHGASRELLAAGHAGHAGQTCTDLASAVLRVVTDPREHSLARAAARKRAEQFTWTDSNSGLSTLRTNLSADARAKAR
jgi:alpha-1,6-mannosyltransferase